MGKHLFVLASLIMTFISGSLAQETTRGGLSYGILYMAGGRYDNVRMCVASAAGVKGGPVGDIMFLTKYTFSEKSAVTFNLPVMRPLLFGLAFQMLQFEPEFTFHYRKVLNDSKALSIYKLAIRTGIPRTHKDPGGGYKGILYTSYCQRSF